MIKTIICAIILMSGFQVKSPYVDAANIEVVWELLRSEPAAYMEWSPNGHYIAYGLWQDNRVIVIDASLGNVKWETPLLPSQLSKTGLIIEWSSDNEFLLAVYDSRLFVVEAKQGDVLWSYQPATFGAFWIEQDQKIAVVNSAREISILSAVTGEVLNNFKTVTTSTSSIGLELDSMTFDWNESTSRYGVFDLGVTRSVWLFDAKGQPLVEYSPQMVAQVGVIGCPGLGDNQAAVQVLKFSADGNMVALAGNGFRICRFDNDMLLSGDQIAGNTFLTDLEWSPDGEWVILRELMSTSTNSVACAVNIYSVQGGYFLKLSNNVLKCGVQGMATHWDETHVRVAMDNEDGLWVGVISFDELTGS